MIASLANILQKDWFNMFNHHLGMDWVIKSSPHVARCPPHLPVSFGFDTACKTYATLVGGGSDSQIIVKANGLCRLTWQMVNSVFPVFPGSFNVLKARKCGRRCLECTEVLPFGPLDGSVSLQHCFGSCMLLSSCSI